MRNPSAWCTTRRPLLSLEFAAAEKAPPEPMIYSRMPGPEVLSAAVQKADEDAAGNISDSPKMSARPPRQTLTKKLNEWAEAGFAHSFPQGSHDPGRTGSRARRRSPLISKRIPPNNPRTPEVTAARAAKLLTNLSAARAAVKESSRSPKGRPERPDQGDLRPSQSPPRHHRRTEPALGTRFPPLGRLRSDRARPVIGRRRAKKAAQPKEAAAVASSRGSAPAADAVALAK